MVPSGLLSLPAELRLDIYDLVYHQPHEQPVDLCQADPPLKSLPLTCRQLYLEASGIYQHNYRKFWSGSDFIIDRRTPEVAAIARQRVSELKENDLQKIRTLKVLSLKKDRVEDELTTSTHVDTRGLWIHSLESSARPKGNWYVLHERQSPGGPRNVRTDVAFMMIDEDNYNDDSVKERTGMEMLGSPGFRACPMWEQIIEVLYVHEDWTEVEKVTE